MRKQFISERDGCSNVTPMLVTKTAQRYFFQEEEVYSWGFKREIKVIDNTVHMTTNDGRYGSTMWWVTVFDPTSGTCLKTTDLHIYVHWLILQKPPCLQRILNQNTTVVSYRFWSHFWYMSKNDKSTYLRSLTKLAEISPVRPPLSSSYAAAAAERKRKRNQERREEEHTD